MASRGFMDHSVPSSPLTFCSRRPPPSEANGRDGHRRAARCDRTCTSTVGSGALPAGRPARSQSRAPSVRRPQAISGRVRLICPAGWSERRIRASVDPYNHRYSPDLYRSACQLHAVIRRIVLCTMDVTYKGSLGCSIRPQSI